MRILIVKTSSLGDVIHALPVLDYLKQVSPGAEIDWVVDEAFADALRGNPLIARLITVRIREWRHHPFVAATWREVAEARQALSEHLYDIIFDIQGNLKSGIILWLTRGKRKVGFARQHLQEPVNRFFTTLQVPFRRQDYHATENYLRVVSVPFGRDYPGMKLSTDIYTGPEEDNAAEALLATLSDGMVFLFHCGTTWTTKLWTEENWVALAQRVLSTYPESTILFSRGNDAEREAALRIATAIGPRGRMLERYSLKGFAALLKKVDLVVGPDTGPIHLAAAVGTPTVSFYRITDGAEKGPRGEGQVIVQSPLSCTGCHRKYCDRDVECRGSITVERMFAGIESLLPEHG